MRGFAPLTSPPLRGRKREGTARARSRSVQLRLSVLAGFALLSMFLGRLYAAQGIGQERGLLDGAKKEGKVVFYTAVETEFARALTGGFEAKYPFIKTDVFRSTHEKVLSRMSVERKTGIFT